MALSPGDRRPVLVLGRAGMDLNAEPLGAPVAEAEGFRATLGGSAANIAAGLARLGVGAALLTCVSDDAVGRFVEGKLDAHGIGRRHVRRTGGETRNTLALVDVRLEGHSSTIYRNGAADFEMDVPDVDAVEFADHSALVVTGTALAAEPSRSATLRALDRAREAGIARILDIDYRPYSWPSAEDAAETCGRAAAHCDIVVGNDVEFGVLAGGAEGALDAARALAASGTEIVVHKMGEHGAITVTPEAEFRTGIYPARPLKPTGAGDAFMAGFLWALSEGRPLRQAVLAGSAAAAIVVGRVGCAPAMPGREEIETLMRDNPDPAE